MSITKKELLKITGISYGQLYRWKRFGLIPEEWFVKQSSYTGQETVFPKEKILERINTIQELKDYYSLEEMAVMLSPELMSNNTVEESVLYQQGIVSESFVGMYKGLLQKESLQYTDLVILYGLHTKVTPHLKDKDIEKLLKNNATIIKNITSVDYEIVIFEYDQHYLMVVGNSMKEFYMDSRCNIITRIQLRDVNDEFKMKFKNLI